MEPQEVAPGVYRVTFNTGPDVARTVTPDGEGIVYASRGLPDQPDAWRLFKAPIAGGALEEVAGLYRRSIRQPILTVGYNAAGRVVAFTRANLDGEFGCANCRFAAGRLPLVSLALYQLQSEDGQALAGLPARSITPVLSFPISGDTLLPGDTEPKVRIGDTVRIAVAQIEALKAGVNPFGPVTGMSSTRVFYSDGETVFQVDLVAGGTPTILVRGAFPRVSLDGSRLAITRPVGLDSSMTRCAGLQNGTLCELVTIEHTLTGWEAVVYDLATLEAIRTVAGSEAAFHPDGEQLLVTRPNGLFWVGIASGTEVAVPNTAGAYAPAVSPTGNVLVYTRDTYGNPDVFFTRLES